MGLFALQKALKALTLRTTSTGILLVPKFLSHSLQDGTQLVPPVPFFRVCHMCSAVHVQPNPPVAVKCSCIDDLIITSAQQLLLALRVLSKFCHVCPVHSFRCVIHPFVHGISTVDGHDQLLLAGTTSGGQNLRPNFWLLEEVSLRAAVELQRTSETILSHHKALLMERAKFAPTRTEDAHLLTRGSVRQHNGVLVTGISGWTSLSRDC